MAVAIAGIAVWQGRAWATRNAEDQQLRAALSPGPNAQPMAEREKLILAASHGRARRSGDTLRLKLANGRETKFVSRSKACAADDAEHCIVYSLLAVLPSRHAYLVDETYYEGGGALLIDDRNGRKTDLPGVPMFSPYADEILTINNDVEYEHEFDLQVWKRVRDHYVMEWGHKTLDVQEECSETLLHWDSNDRLTVRFSADSAQPRPVTWTGTLIRSNGRWRLEMLIPAVVLNPPPPPGSGPGAAVSTPRTATD